MFLIEICCFFGHRQIFNKQIVRERLYTLVEELIKKGCNKFLIGTHGDFDSIALSVCRELRKKYDIKIIVVFTSLSKITKTKDCDVSDADLYKDCETLIYNIEEQHFKNQITYSNQRMIDNSDCVVCYVDESKSISGAKKAMKYALKNKKEVKNLFIESDNPTYGMNNKEKQNFWNNIFN